MPALPIPQQSDWSNNVYVVATTCIFVMIGMAYLMIKTMCNRAPSIWGTRSAAVAAVVSEAIELDDITSDAAVPMPSTLSTDPDLEANLTLEVCLPQPSYDPQDHAERSWAHVGAQDQSVEVDGVYTAVDAMPELDVGIRNDDPHIEEGVDYTIGLAG